jgi:hypothetical protein
MADVSRVVVSGPLGPFAAGFVDDLWRQGFGPVAVRKHVALLAGLSGWLAAEDVAVSALSSEVAERFCYGAARGGAHASADHPSARSTARVSAGLGRRAASESAGLRGAG